MKELKKLVFKKFKEMNQYFKKYHNIDLSNTKIKIDLITTSTLGLYDVETNTIHLHKELLKEFKEIYIEDTFVHEVVHVFIHKRYPFGDDENGKRIMPHGKHFKNICKVFNNDGKPTTDIYNNAKFFKN